MKLKYMFYTLCLAPMSVLAQESVLPADVTNAFEDLKDMGQELGTKALGLIAGVIAIALGIWAIPKAVGWIKRAFGR